MHCTILSTKGLKSYTPFLYNYVSFIFALIFVNFVSRKLLYINNEIVNSFFSSEI